MDTLGPFMSSQKGVGLVRSTSEMFLILSAKPKLHFWPFHEQNSEFNPFPQSKLVFVIDDFGRGEDLFRLPQPPSTGLLLICMIEKHTLIFRALQGNQGVAAT